MNIDLLSKKIAAPFIYDGAQLNEIFHMSVDSVNLNGNRPYIDLVLELNPKAREYFQNTLNAVLYLVFPGSIAIEVKKMGETNQGGSVELNLISNTNVPQVNQNQIININDHGYREWLEKFYSHNPWIENMVYQSED